MRKFKYKEKWYQVGDIIKIGKYFTKKWQIKFIGIDACAIIKRKKQIKIIIGNVKI